MKNKPDLEAALKKAKELSPQYWKDRFRSYDLRRLSKNKEMESVVLFLLNECLEDIYEFIYSFYGKYAEGGIVPDEVARVQMDSKELLQLIGYLNSLMDLAAVDGIRFDKDIEEKIQKLSTSSDLTRIQGLVMKVQARIEYAYGNLEKRMDSHVKGIGDEAYWTTVYEIYKAVGYGKKPDDDETMVPFIAYFAWRSSKETYDEVMWRYKRELEFNVEREIKLNTALKHQTTPLLEKVSSLFKRDNKNLKAMANTDSTFASTLGQEEAFDNLGVAEALYCTIDDERRSEICTELDGSVIPVDEIEPWVNAPPMHYNCRSWLTPIIDNVGFLEDGEAYDMEGLDFSAWYDTWV